MSGGVGGSRCAIAVTRPDRAERGKGWSLRLRGEREAKAGAFAYAQREAKAGAFAYVQRETKAGAFAYAERERQRLEPSLTRDTLSSKRKTQSSKTVAPPYL
jgi:hypothetical protein